ncbi:NUDIX domain-containing protein [Rhodococcus hoagii]|nr:NUDIX domain-containing protein [Prescottella equi]
MHPAVGSVHQLVSDIDAFDDLEREHIADSLAWIESTDDIFRRAKPATPPRHLVSYTVVVDPSDHSVFLVDHIKSGLQLPTGGHVEPGEHPLVAAKRETREELGIEADFTVAGAEPLFITVTTTVGAPTAHVDVSLWYVIAASRDTQFTLDPREFRAGRWWTPREVRASDPEQFDPHFLRFMEKLRATAPGR